MRSLSPELLKALFAEETSDTLICLITVYDPDNPSNVLARVANAMGKDSNGNPLRIYEDDQNVFYGVRRYKNGIVAPENLEEYYYIPLEILLPSEEEGNPPRASIVLHDVTRYLIPIVRSITGQPKVQIDLILDSDPNQIEVSYTDLYISSISYNADSITAELAMVDYSREPCPTHSFTPQYFPGLF